MKICIVCTKLSVGGAERVAVSWANGFLHAGHEVMVISNLYDPVTYQLEDGILVRNLVSDNNNKIKKWGSSFFNIRKQLKEFRPDVVLGVMATCSFASKVAALGLGVTVVATEHYSFDLRPFKEMGLIEKFSKFYLNRMYRHVTVLTEEDKRVIGKRLKHVSVMPNPLALQPINVDVEKPNHRERVILAAGRLAAWYVKGFDVLIKAWGKLNKRESTGEREEIDQWRLQITGAGSEESLNYLKQLCKENGVEDSVDFLGFVSDMESLYKKASVFVLSSRYEGFGLVLIEAMSQGCACIACDHKGRQKEIMCPSSPQSPATRVGLTPPLASTVSCENGILCPPEDVEAMSQAMMKMITDAGYRESVRNNAIERSKYYSINNVVEKWENLLQQVVPS